MFFNKKICLVFGGGGARGLLHLGVLKVLEENDLVPDMIVGTSMGAIVGAAFACQTHSTSQLIELFEQVLFSKEFEKLGLEVMEDDEANKKLHFLNKLKNSIAKYKYYRKMFTNKFLIEYKVFKNLINGILPDKNIEDLPLKFAAIALDLIGKEEVILTKGSLIKSVIASSAIPGIIEPVKFEKKLLADGGWIDKVPVPAARKLGADKIIAVDVSKKIKKSLDYKNGFQIMRIAENMAGDYLTELQVVSADLLLKPELEIHWYDFHEFKKLIKMGETITRENIIKIKKIFGQRRSFFFLNNLTTFGKMFKPKPFDRINYKV